jgi:hypothetical protein
VAGGAFDFGGLALHPSGRVAVVGSVAGKRVFVVDLQALATLVAPGDALADPLPVTELAVPALADGPPAALCPGSASGVAFNHAGDRLYVSERCDGSLTTFSVALPAAPQPIGSGDFGLASSEALLSSLAPENFGDQRDPSVLRVRPGVPGIDFDGPDLFFLSGQPSAQVCALRVESP